MDENTPAPVEETPATPPVVMPAVKQELSDEGQYIIESWHKFNTHRKSHANEETYDVSDVFGFVAYIYEKIRSSVENKSEHILRRFAIERALRRIEHLPLEDEDRAERLIKELTWSHFLPNNTVTRPKMRQVTKIIQKYQLLRSHLPQLKSSESHSIYTWIRGIASTEIEEILTPSFNRQHLVPTMYMWLRDRYVWEGSDAKTPEFDTQLYIASHRALAKSDTPILRYHLLTLLKPNWESADEPFIQETAAELPRLVPHIENLINHPQKNLIFRFVQQNTAPFLILDSVLESAPDTDTVLRHPDELEQKIREVANAKYSKIRKDVRRGIVRSILYIFATKVIIALLLEYPYERFILGHINLTNLGINILFPPILMFLMGQTVKVPGEDNTLRIIKRIKSLIYKPDTPVKPIPANLQISNKQKRLGSIFTIFYLYLFFVTVVTLSYLLVAKLDFNWISASLFFMFMSLVLLFGFRLRWQAQEILVASPRQGIFDHFISMLSIPFINLGVWLSSTLSQINFLTFVLDRIIDAPLKSSVNSAEEWTKFLKRKQQEAVEVPGE